MKVILLANTDWYLYNFRLALARHLVESGHEVMLASPDGEFRSQLIQAGFNHVVIPIDRKPSLTFRDVLAITQLWRVYLRFSPDVVHHFTIKAVVCGMLAAKLAGVPGCVNSITGLGYAFTEDGRRAGLIRLIVRLALRLCLSGTRSSTIVQNEADKSMLLKHRLGVDERMYLIPGSGVNLNHFLPTHKKERLPIKVLMASRYLFDKGIREFLAAAEAILSRREDVEFILAGAPDPGNPTSIDINEFDYLARTKGFRNIGYHYNIIELLREVDIVVLPSYREGLPRSLLEAAACGLPIVATNVPGCNDVVVDQINGFLVPVRSIAPLVDAICTLVESNKLRSEMGFAGRERVEKHFSEDIILAKTVNVYQKSRNDISR